MAANEPARTARRMLSTILAALVIVSATLIGVVSGRLPGPSPASFASPGAVRRGLTVFDNERPAVANLDPDLLRALRHAAKDAARQRVEIVVNSGWRSPEYQKRLPDLQKRTLAL